MHQFSRAPIQPKTTHLKVWSIHPEYDALIPALQKAMDALRMVKPDVNESAERTVMTLRAILLAPNSLPSMDQEENEAPDQFAKRVVRNAQEWTE